MSAEAVSADGPRPGSLDGLRLALGTLTRIPAGAVHEVTRPVARTAMLAGSLVMVPVALVAAAIGQAAVALGAPALVGGLLVVGIVGQLTRAMHWDGLADTADGLGASWDRERALDVMRTGDVGPMGAATLVIVLGLQAASFGALLGGPFPGGNWWVVAAIICASRAILAPACAPGVRPARPEGLGQAVASSVPVAAALLAWLVWAGVFVLLLGAPGLLVAAAGLVTGLVLLAWCVRRLGGITGDVLGGCIEASATGLAVVAAMVA